MNQQIQITQDTKVTGVIGHPIKQSFSPFIHNFAFNLLDMDYIYLATDVFPANLKAALNGIVALDIKGFNVTIPYKEKVIPFLKDISEEAHIVGAVNTVVNEDGALHGYNTDANGITKTLEPYKDEIAGKTVSVIGAGGGARSVIFVLARYFNAGKINIINRTKDKAESLADYFAAKMHFDQFEVFGLIPPDITHVFFESDVIINATSIGMLPAIDDSPTTIAESFREGQIVFDIVYNPLKTKFLVIAESRGAKIINGLQMFIEQASRSFELWSGKQMPTNEIYTALEEHLK